jgi:seryl-tRNA synthetase
MIEVAQPHLLALAEQTGESASLAALDGTEVVYVARVPVRRIMSINVSIGTRVPAHATSMGRALLAWAPQQVVERVIAESGLRALTARTITDPERFRAALVRKAAAEAFDALLAADERWRALVPQVDELRARTKLKGRPTPEQLEELQRLKEELRAAEDTLAAAEAEREQLLLQVPHPPDDSAPDGDSEEDAVEIARFGEPPDLQEPRDATEIGRFEMERAARVSGSRFGYLVGDAALLALALYRAAIDHLVEQGFTPMLPPVLVREAAMVGTGFFPTERSNIYALEDDPLFLTGTSEVALAAFHTGEILDEGDLPLRYTAFSPCFRREAGAAGKDTRGMFRVHQFNKVEMFVFTKPDESRADHESMVELEEAFLRKLDIPYRVVNVAAGDLGASAVKKIDIEAWFPSQGRYREVTSCSNTTDFQARRLGIRFRSERGLETPHTLNGTMVSDRAVLAILENYQGEVPDALVAFGAPEHISA